MGQIWNRIRRIAQSYRYDTGYDYTLPEDDEDRKLKEIIDELSREQSRREAGQSENRTENESARKEKQQQSQQPGGMTLAAAATVLGVQPTAGTEEIKKAYKRLMLQYHPDRVPPEGQVTAQRKAREINAAYQFLRKEKGF